MSRREEAKKRRAARITRWLDYTGDFSIVPGTWRRKGTPAYVTGIFRPRMVIDPALEVAPQYVRTFVLYHEAEHAVGRHGLILLLALLFTGPFVVLAKRWAEEQADRCAAEVMIPKAFAAALEILYQPPRGLRGLPARLLYGRNWIERCERAGISVR